MMHRRHLLAASAAGLAIPRIARADPHVLRFVPQADLAVLDPVWTTAYITGLHAQTIFETLFAVDADLRPRHQMLAGHTVSPDGREWRLTLRDGLRFHDGEKVLARDCVASLTRWGQRDTLGIALFAATDELSAPDDRTIRFRLKRPFPMLPFALGKANANLPAIMPARLAGTPATARVTEMVGSGAYRFKADEWRQGDRVVYERFDRYVPRADGTVSFLAGPRAAVVDRVEWRIMPDPGTAAAALAAGEIDWWERPTPDLLALLRRNRAIRTAVLDPLGALQFLRFNHLFAPFDNADMRRALLGAISQTDTMTAAGGTDPAVWNDRCGAFTPGTTFATEAGLEVMTGPRDMARVKRDLAAAGYNGERIVFLGVGDVAELQAISQVTADALARAGLNLDHQVLDWGTVVQRRGSKEPPDKGGWHIMHSGFGGADMLNPATNIPLRGNAAQAWFGWPDIPRLEELRDAWMVAPDIERQKAIAAQMQGVMWEQVPYIPLGLIRRPTAWRTSLGQISTGGTVFSSVRPA